MTSKALSNRPLARAPRQHYAWSIHWKAPLRAQTVAVAAKSRLPTIYPFRETVEVGGLMSYGTSLPDQYRQAATFMHKLLNGATPAALPVEQPVELELVINLKTAKALGLEVPPTILARAEVIE
jgi:putative tryptophan/tyrosine transport system substrate-binding protein